MPNGLTAGEAPVGICVLRAACLRYVDLFFNLKCYRVLFCGLKITWYKQRSPTLRFEIWFKVCLYKEKIQRYVNRLLPDLVKIK